MKSHRLARVAEVVREVAAEAILFDLRDPRIKGVTVTRAEVSADLQHAKVHVSLMGTEREQNLTLHGLKSSAGFVQSKLAKRLTTRYVPHVEFILDEGVKKSIEISRIIAEEQKRRGEVGVEIEDDSEYDDEDEALAEETEEMSAEPPENPSNDSSDR
jgi:ribosome-binding factor A